MPRPASLLTALLLAACGTGSAAPTPPRFAGGCEVEAARAIDRNDAPLGFTAEEAALRAAMRDDLLLVWEGGEATPLAMGIEAIDADRVFHVLSATERIGEVEIPCPQGLTFPARIRFHTADGAFDERFEVDVFARAAGRQEWVLWLPFDRLNGNLTDRWMSAEIPREIGIAARLDAGGLRGGVTAAVEHRGDLALARLALWGEDGGF